MCHMGTVFVSNSFLKNGMLFAVLLLPLGPGDHQPPGQHLPRHPEGKVALAK